MAFINHDVGIVFQGWAPHQLGIKCPLEYQIASHSVEKSVEFEILKIYS